MEFIGKLNEFSVNLETFINKNKRFDIEKKIEEELSLLGDNSFEKKELDTVKELRTTKVHVKKLR